LPPNLRARAVLDHHDVGREVVLATDQARSDAIHVDGNTLALELAYPLRVEASRHDDSDAAMTSIVERPSHEPHQLGVDPSWIEGAHVFEQRAVHDRVRRVQA